MKLRLMLAVLACCAASACSDDPVAPDGNDEPKTLAEKLDQMTPELLGQYNVPGAAVGLIVDGTVQLSKGYGMADLAAERAVTDQTAFAIGAVSSMLAGWAVTYLVDDSKLNLEAPVEAFLDGWTFPPSDFDSREVTIERLLEHRGGTSLAEYPGFPFGQALPTVQESLDGATNGAGNVSLVYTPDSKIQYSAGGITVIQLAVDVAVKINFLSYRTLVEEDILAPLGITSSQFVISPSIAAALATPYNSDGDAVEQRQYTARAAAGLFTNLADMLKWAKVYIDVYGGEPAHVPGLVVANIVSVLNAAVGPDPVYKLGQPVRRIGGVTLIGHSGGHEGWRAFIQIDVEGGNAIVVLTNSANGAALGNELVCTWMEDVTAQSPAEFCSN